MSVFEVQSVGKPSEYKGDKGTVYYYQISGIVDGDLQICPLKPGVMDQSKAPKVGDKIEGELKDGKFGPEFHKEKKPFTGGFDNPERNAAIEFQSARRDAIALLAARAQFMTKEKALEFLTIEHILTTAERLQKKPTLAPLLAPIPAQASPLLHDAKEMFSEPLPTPPEGEINVDDIPF